MPPSPPVGNSSREEPRTRFLSETCLPALLQAQNRDGGWGQRHGSRSSVEATCWALLALDDLAGSDPWSGATARGANWLTQAQLPDGGWPAYQGQREGCWVTALAGLALQACARAPEAVERGIQWLCEAWPGEGGWWWRVRIWLHQQSVVPPQHFYRGWSWTAGTSSWVEPTSYALLLLRKLPRDFPARRATRRRQLGEAMLWDRVCPGGGWNCGNPLVYGAAGRPEIIPTAWALLALHDSPDRPESQKSLQWLEHAYARTQGPGSLALAHLCLETYGRAVSPLEPTLRILYARNEFFHSIPVMAWAAIALHSTRNWLRHTSHQDIAG